MTTSTFAPAAYSTFQCSMMRDVIAQYPGTSTAQRYEEMLKEQFGTTDGEGVNEQRFEVDEPAKRRSGGGSNMVKPGQPGRHASEAQMLRIGRELAKRDLTKVQFGLFSLIKSYEAGTIGPKDAHELIDWLGGQDLKEGAPVRGATEKQVANVAKWGPAKLVDAETEAVIAKALAGEFVSFDEAHRALDIIFDKTTPRKDATPAAKVNAKVEAALVEGSPEVIYDGVYTVTYADGTYKTLKLRTQKADARFRPGVQLVKYLSGPDNTNDYTGFGEVHGGTVKIWKKFADNEGLAKACKVMLGAKDAEQGATFEVSVSCFRCGRPLTVPASMHDGYGPDCINM